jgi:hypothetical protein
MRIETRPVPPMPNELARLFEEPVPAKTA